MIKTPCPTLELNEDSSSQEIIDNSNHYIYKYKSEGNKSLLDFFSNIQKLILMRTFYLKLIE